MTSGRKVISRDPNSVLDYMFDWTAWLAEGEIISNQICIFAGVEQATPIPTISGGNKVVVWVQGGVENNGIDGNYVTCRITTNAGRVDDRTYYFNVHER